MLMTCKQVAEALSETHFDKMSAPKQKALRFHLAVCLVCGKFHKDVIRMQRFVDELRRREESEDEHTGVVLDDDCRYRIEKAIHDARETDSGN